MNDQIICPHCKRSIPLTEALSHQLQEKYQKKFTVRLHEEKIKLEQDIRASMEQKIKSQMDLQFKDKANETEELKKQNSTLQEQLLETNKLIRQIKQEMDLKKLEFEKRLSQEQEIIRDRETKRLNDEYRLKILEKDKKLQDALSMVDDYKRKLEQGSQQTQGEVLELELEQTLRTQFPLDEIKEVPKGVRGADIIQVVKNQSGRVSGTIIWESKRTKAWSNEWLAKLKEDQRTVKAEVAVIITDVLPNDIINFGIKEGVWVGGYKAIIGLAMTLRHLLIEVMNVRSASMGKKEKMDVLWNYLTGIEFRQRVEAITEAFGTLQNDIEKEKRWFAAKWAKQEKNIRKVMDNTLGMHGDLQSIMGRALGEIRGIDILPPGVEEAPEKKLF